MSKRLKEALGTLNIGQIFRFIRLGINLLISILQNF